MWIRGNCTDILKQKMEDTKKIVKALEESDLLPEGASKTIKNKINELKDGFIGLLLRTLTAILIGNMLAEVIRASGG